MVLSLLEFPLCSLVLSLLGFWLVVAFLHSCNIFGVIFVVVFGGVAIWDGISKAIKKIKSRIMVVSVCKRVHAVDNARWYGERGKGTSFYVVSCTEVEEPEGTLEIYYWSEAYSRFCAGLCGVSWGVFLCALAYAPNSIFQCLLKSMVVHVMNFRRDIVQGMPLFTGILLSQKLCLTPCGRSFCLGIFCRVTSSVYCGPVTLPSLFVSQFVGRVHRLP